MLTKREQEGIEQEREKKGKGEKSEERKREVKLVNSHNDVINNGSNFEYFLRGGQILSRTLKMGHWYKYSNLIDLRTRCYHTIGSRRSKHSRMKL